MSFDFSNKNIPQGVKQNFAETKTRIEAIENQKGAADGLCPLGSDGYVPLGRLPSIAKSSKVAADITARNAIISGDRFEGLRVHVLDATADTSVSLGSAGYILKSGLTNSDWEKTYEDESLDIDFSVFLNVDNDTSDRVDEGVSNLYFTAARAKAASVIGNFNGEETDQAGSVSATKAYVAATIASTPKNWVKKTATGTLIKSESKVFCNITAANITLTLPSVGASDDGQAHFVLNKSSSTKTVTVIGSDADTVGGSATIVLQAGEYVEFIYEHSTTDWFVKD
jgi:hypothetical protein